jgi:hypothetical protein
MDFMNNNMARALSQTNKYVRTYVMKHKARWGFILAPYSENPDGTCVINLNNKVYRGVLRHAELLSFKRTACRASYGPMWGVYSRYLGMLVYGTEDEIAEVKKEAEPFMTERMARRRAMLQAEEKTRLADAKRQAYIDTDTIKAGPAPAINPWLNRAI